MMRTRRRSRLAWALGLAALGLPAIYVLAAGPKTSGIYTVSDDLTTGSTGSVDLGAGVYSVSGSVGQTGSDTSGAGGSVVQGGYFAFGGNQLSVAAFSGLGDNTLTANWGSNFAPGFLYTAELSTGGFPNSFTGNQSSATVGLSASFTGLAPATLYFARVSTSAATGPYLSLGSTVTTGGIAGAFGAMPYTNIYSNGLTANWSSTFPGGTVYRVQISSDGFATINSSNTTTNPNFVYNGLNPSTGYNVRVSTSPSGLPSTVLGLVNTPAIPVAQINFNFTGGPAAAVIASGNGQNEMGANVVVDTISANGPFVFVLFESTTGATGASSTFHAVAKYGSAGTLLSSRTLAGPDTQSAMALDGAGNLYVGEKDNLTTTRWITKYSPNLIFMSSAAVPASDVGNISNMVSDGAFLYTINDSGADNAAKVIKYNASLVPLATAAYTLGGSFVLGDSIALDPSGSLYVAVSSNTAGAPKHLLKYPAAFNGASPSFDVVVPGAAGSSDVDLAFSAGKVFAGFPTPSGTNYLVRQFDSSLNYAGVTSTVSNTVPGTGGGVRAGPDASVFAGSTLNSGDGGDYLVMKFNAGNNLAFMSSATFNSPTFLADRAKGLAVLSSTAVFITGSSSNTIADANAVTARLVFNVGGGGACAAPIASGAPFTAISTNSLTANWVQEPTCPAGTILTALISPTPFNLGTIVSTVTTSGDFATFIGLAPGTNYTVVVSTTGQFAGSFALPPAATLNTAVLSLSGTLSYPGLEPGDIQLQAFTNAASTGLPVSSQTLSNVPTQPYYLTLAAGTYYLRAYLDVLDNKVFQPWADKGALGPVSIVASSVTGQNFSITVDSIAPNSPVGLSAAPSPGQVLLTWAAPTTSTNGAVLQDLRGFIVQRSTAGAFVSLAGSPAVPLSSAALTFIDFAPMPSVANSYRLLAVDFERNLSAPSSPVTVPAGATAVGGMISGRISTFTTTTSGVFRVRLSTGPGVAALSESNQNPYNFPGLSSGTYFLTGFRDLDNDSAQGSLEPAGTFGGLHNNPFPVYISGGNTVTADVTLCDRSLLQVGPLLSATLATDGCPALEAGPGHFTNPLVFEAGTAAPASVALNSPLVINMSRLNSGSALFDSKLIVLGPGGQIIASNSSPAGAAVSFAPTQAGVYVVEPTSFLGFSTGAYTLRMSSASSGSDPGEISGTLSYGGAQTGSFIMRFFDNPSFAGIPVATQTVASAGPFNRVSLPLGTYFVDAFRDTSGSGAFNAAYQAYGRCNAGAGVTLTVGSPVIGIGACVVADPSGPLGGGASISGAVTYKGVLTGVLRTSLFPLGSSSPVGSTAAVLTPSLPAPFSFPNLSSGTYVLKSFLDGNSNFVPDAGEPVITSTATGIALLTATGVSGQNLILCDRRPITAGTPINDSWTSADCRAPDRGGAFLRLYTFSGARGQPVTIEAVASGFYGTFLALYDEGGTLVATDDGGAASGNAKLSDFELPLDGLYTIGASPYAANVAGQIRLSLTGSRGALGSIAGSVNYTGSQGGDLLVGLFSSTVLSSSTQVGVMSVSSDSAFGFEGLETGTTYYLDAFVDVNFNLLPDIGEDSGHFGANGLAAPILLAPGQNLSGINILVAPSTGPATGAAYVSGSIGYGGGQSISAGGQLRVEFWSDSLFQGNPVAIRSLPNGTTPYTYDMTAPGGQAYFIRAFLDVDNDQILDPNEPKGLYAPHNQGAEPLFVPLSANLSAVDFSIADPGGDTAIVTGEGTAAVSVSTVAAGASFSATITYTAGPGGIKAGGRIGFIVPAGFSFPQGVTVTPLTGTAAYDAPVFSGPAVSVRVNSGSLTAGQKMRFNYNNAFAPCLLSSNTFTVVSASSITVPAPLFSLSASTLSVVVLPGAPAVLAPANPYFSLTQYELSPVQGLEARDTCGNRAALSAPAALALRAKSFDFQTGQFATDNTVGLTVSPALPTAASLDLPFAVGQASSSFYVVSTATGVKNIELFYNLGTETTFYYGFTVLPSNALTNVSVTTSAAGVGRSSVTISLNLAFLNFDLGDANQPWHVTISSVPYRDGFTVSPLWETWGQGQPSRGQVVWDGRSSPWINGGARVAGGLYYVRVSVGGTGVHDDSVSIGVNAPQLAGRFFDAGVVPNPPLSAARITLFGPNGTVFTQTDAQGGYILTGTSPGDYNMAVTRADYLDANLSLTISPSGLISTFTALTAGVSASTNASAGLDVRLNRSSILLVAPSLVNYSTKTVDQWGALQVRPASTSSAQSPVFGPLRLAAGTTTFDDGEQWDPSSQRFITRTQLRFNLAIGTYTVEASFTGFAPSSATVYVGQGVTTLGAPQLPSFTRKSTLSGLVTVNPNPNGVTVSVSAIPTSTSTLVSGGSGSIFLNSGVTNGVYTVSNLDAGSYLLRANVQGYPSISTGPISVPISSDVTNVNFPPFVADAQIAGNATVNINTAGKNLVLFVSAWAPGALNFGSTQVYRAGGASGLVIPYIVKGLDSGATYQMYTHLQGLSEDPETLEAQPLSVVATAAAVKNFSFIASSGTIDGAISLPAGSTDFTNVFLFGKTIESPRPEDVGNEFVRVSTALPNFRCEPSGNSGAVGCLPNESSATFKVTGLKTQTLDLTLFYKTTGETKTSRLSIVNGATTTVVISLAAPTFSISGGINNQITNALFNTNPAILANAPFLAPAGYPTDISSSTARVNAIKQNISQFSTAISDVFDPATTRVGFLSAAGTFTITGLPSGVYYVRTVDLRACATCSVLVPRVGRIVSVNNAHVSGVTFTLSDGYSVSGAVSLDGGLQDARVFDLVLRNRRQEIVRSTSVYLGDAGLGLKANTVAYSFGNLPADDFYTLSVDDASRPARYVGKPIKFPDAGLSPNGLQSNLSAQNVSLQRAAFIVGRLKDANTGELIGSANAGLLAPNFRISATANPWVEGGFVVAAASVAARPIEADGYFRVGPLIPNAAYDLRLAQTSWDPSFLARGSQNYAPVQLGGLTPSPGESKDVGVLSLNQGSSLTGTLRQGTTSGMLLGNIKIVARPSFGDSDVVVQTYTNPQGVYTVWVSTFLSNQFDVTAAPRDGNLAANGSVYGEVTRHNVNLLATTTADFLLNPLLANVTGQVVVEDAATGGQLSYPFRENKGFPAAAINLQPAGVVPVKNPLGDIEAVTEAGGRFNIVGLTTGTYTLKATSLGYAVFNATVAASTSTFRIYTDSDTPSNVLAGSVLTLKRGATVTGRILKTDGSAPSENDVAGVVAANFAAGEYVVGSVDVDQTAKTVNSYTISGFKPGVSYDLVILPKDKSEDISFPPEGSGISFTAAESTATKSINLTFASSGLDCQAGSKVLGNGQFKVTIDCSKGLRKSQPSDDDLNYILTVATFNRAGVPFTAPNGAGEFLGSNKSLSSDRKNLQAIYRTVNKETAFSLRLRAVSSTVNPKTGANFTLDKVFDFFVGVDVTVANNVSNISGGNVQMEATEADLLLGLDELSRLDFQAGTFAQVGAGQGGASVQAIRAAQAAGLAVAGTTISVSVGMRRGSDQQTMSALYVKKLGYAPASLEVLASPSAFPPEMGAAMQAYRTLAAPKAVGGANPLSSFYDIFLPAGIRHQLQQNADLTLSYNLVNSTGATADSINIWFYNATTGRFELETRNKRIDEANKTITVSVDHFSVFVVLDSTPIASRVNTRVVDEILAVNFPNPADCITHYNIPVNNALFGAGGVHAPFQGTMIRFSLPGATSEVQDAKINVYNLAGELVRTMNPGSVQGGFTHYVPWNCANDSGQTVGSGVYLGEVIWGGKRKFFKMAIIKGSGL